MARASIDFSALPDEEGYIYLDSSGKAQARFEIAVVWAQSSASSTLVTLDRKYCALSEDVKYLPLKIAESLERFPVFEGLSNLSAVNLQKENGRLLPEVIGK